MPRAEAYFRDVMLNARPGLAPSLLRTLAAAGEWGYSRLMSARNHAYDRGYLKSYDLGRPTLSVGNLSAGGTGKTPVVAWLAAELVRRGHKPAVLLRGYRAVNGLSDEAAELASAVGNDAPPQSPDSPSPDLWRVPVWADGNRIRGAAGVLAERPETDLFLLDDAMQHRRARRQVDICLISATQGLCHRRVLPRGLLRERPEGLRRADILIITRADQATPQSLQQLHSELHDLAPGKPILTCTHGVTAIATDAGELWSPAAAHSRRVFAVAGTGDPAAFGRTVTSLGATLAGHLWFNDHHAYTPADWAEVGRHARAAGAEAVITTGKDWVKLAPLGKPAGLDVWIVRIAATFPPGDADRLMDVITHTLDKKRPHGRG